MYPFTLLITVLILTSVERANAATISIRVDNSDIETHPVGSIVNVRVGTRVLLISFMECAWEWEIENKNSHAFTAETSGLARLLHIVPYTREEAGVYRCLDFTTAYNITLLAGPSNLFRSYGASSIEGVRNNSVLLLTADIQISCIQSEVLVQNVSYWRGPNGSEVGTSGSVYTDVLSSRGEAVLHILGSDGANISEGAYTCMLDTGDEYRVLVYRDVYAVVRGSGEREVLGEGAEVRYVEVGHEISLICPRDSIPEYLGDNEGNIIKLIQIIYIPLFTLNEAGLYQCRSARKDNHIRLVATGSALLLQNSSSISLLGNDSVIVVSGKEDGSLVCAGSEARNGTGSLWSLNGKPVPAGNGTLVELSYALGGLRLDLSKVTGAYQGVYLCAAGAYNGTSQVHTVAVYLAELQLEFVTETGSIINGSAVIFLNSREFNRVTCRSAESYPSTVSANWTSTPEGYSAVNMGTLDLSGIETSGMYTCTAASLYSTGSKFLYIIMDNAHANLTLTYNNRKSEFSNSEVHTVEIEVGSLNVTIECKGFNPELTLPTGTSYTVEDSSAQSVAYIVDVMTPAYNGLVSCTGVSHHTTSVRLKAVGVALIRRLDGMVSTLNTGISVVEGTEYFLCTGSDLNATSGWQGSNSSQIQTYLRTGIYQEILRFARQETVEGFYTCRARNETGGVEEITRGLFYSQPFGPSISFLVNGTNWTENVYTLKSNSSISLECHSNSYPMPISTLWYQNTTRGAVSSSRRLNLTLTQQNISLSCVVRTLFAANQKILTIVNPFLSVKGANSTPTMAPNQTMSNYTNSSNTTDTPLAPGNSPVYIVLTTLIIVVIIPFIVLVVSIVVHNMPANVKEHAKKRWKQIRLKLGRRQREQDEMQQSRYIQFTTNRDKYKEVYGFKEVEDAISKKKVKYWEPNKIRAEYEQMKILANVTNEMYNMINEQTRITPEVEVGDDLRREAVERKGRIDEQSEVISSSIRVHTPSRPGTPDSQGLDSDSRRVLLRKDYSSLRASSPVQRVPREKAWSSTDQSHLLINIRECPDFILVKGPYIKPAKKWRRGKRASKDPELQKKIDYLDFLFDNNAEDVVNVAYQPENSSLKRSEIVFYPQGPKDRERAVKIGNYTIKTKSYFSAQFYTMRQLVITREKEEHRKKTDETREIRLFHFLIWPKVEVGSQTYPFIEFVRALRCKKQNPVVKKSIVLHCDAGNRSATFISIYYLLKRIERNNDFNLVQFFCEVNEQVNKTAELFPTYTQYEFLHSIILDLTLNDTTCQSSELDTKFKALFDRPRDYVPRIEGRIGIFMEELELEEKEANKTRAQIQRERDEGLQNLEEKFQRRQRKRAERQKIEKEKERKERKIGEDEETQFGLVKQEESFVSDDEIEYIENPRQFIPTLCDVIRPEPLFIKTDPAVERFRRDERERRKRKAQQNQKNKPLTLKQKTEESPVESIELNILAGGRSPDVNYSKTEPMKQEESEKNKFDLIKETEKEFKQLQMFRPNLLQQFAHPPLYTNYRTHKKHVEGSREEEVIEFVNDEKKEKKKEKYIGIRKLVKTNRRELSIEEKLSQDECTRFEQFKFGQRQTQVYGPNLVEENQSQGFCFHSLYGDEIVATRHPCVNDFEFANFNHPQFNLHLYKQQRIPTVVVLCTFEELIEAYRIKKDLKQSNVKRNGRQSLTPYWPPIGEENLENFGPFKVRTESSEVFDDDKLMQWYDLRYEDTKDLDEHCVRVFLCKDWDTLMETNHTTLRHERFVHFVTSILSYTKQTRSDKVAVHCSDVKAYSALFSAVFYALRQAENEGKIDMYHIVKGIQMSRRQSSVFMDENQYFLSLKLTSDCLLNVAKARKEMMQES